MGLMDVSGMAVVRRPDDQYSARHERIRRARIVPVGRVKGDCQRPRVRAGPVKAAAYGELFCDRALTTAAGFMGRLVIRIPVAW